MRSGKARTIKPSRGMSPNANETTPDALAASGMTSLGK
jgi:hypothetical protein